MRNFNTFSMVTEGMGRRFSPRDQKTYFDAQAEADEYREGIKIINPVKVDNTPRQLEVESSDWKGLGSERRLYTEEQLEEMFIRHASTFAKLGYSEVALVPNSVITGYDKTIYAVEIQGVDRNKTHEFGWVTLHLDENNDSTKNFSYVCNLGNKEQVLDVVRPPNGFEFEWLQNQSESSKTVKSRPMWMYPELFDLPREEVWPKNADVAVIGDPYQACDRERTTIVEYEYADEMVPPVLRSSLQKDTDTSNAAKFWLEDLYHEDFRALENVYGQWSPRSTNPYKHFAEVCIRFVNDCTNKLAVGQELDPSDKDELDRLRTFKLHLTTGSWTIEEGRELARLHDELSGDGFSVFDEEDLRKWHEYKEYSLDSLGNPESWKEYIERWENYLARLPKAYLEVLVPNFDKKIKQAEHWLKILPTTKSPERSMAGRNYLNNFYDELMTHYDQKDDDARPIYDTKISFIEERGLMGDGAFGFFMPGYPLSKRHRNAVEEFLQRAEQIVMYSKTIHPKLEEERKRLEERGVPLPPATMYSYLRSYEQAYARQQFFYKRTQKAVPVHGFFPHNMPGMDPQDRILALTSVTMHGWNSLNETGFRNDIEAALPYLKIGGKYILGPVNQEIFFGYPTSNFATGGLTSALRSLKEEGKIEYSFKKGRRVHNDRWDGEPEDDPVDRWSSDPTALLRNESAASLVITRLV